MHGAEDINSQPVPKDMQGLGGQMASNDAQGWKGPDRNDQDAKRWDVPHLDDRGLPRPGPQPSYEGKGPLINPPAYGHYDLPSEKKGYRFEGEAEGSKAKGEPVDWDATLHGRSNSKFEVPKSDEDILFANRKDYQEENAKRQDADRKQTYTNPQYQRPQTQQSGPKPQPFPISDTFTPRTRNKPVPDSTLRSSPEWLYKSGMPPTELNASPFVVPSRPLVRRAR
jgi:hypothetical protein